MNSIASWLPASIHPFRSVSPIGVDFDSNRVHFTQFDVTGALPKLREARSVKYAGSLEDLLSSPAELRRVVDDALHRSLFRGRKIVTDIPRQDLRLMVLNYNLDVAASEPETILALARERMRDDLEQYVVDFVPIRTSGEKQGDYSALVAIATEESAIAHIERLSAAGLKVQALEIPPVAIQRIVAFSGRVEIDRTVLVIQIGEKTTELTLLSGRRLLLYREVEIGAETILEEAAKALDCDRAAAQDLLSSFGVGLRAAPVSVPIKPAAFEADDDSVEDSNDIVTALREIVRPSLRSLVGQVHKAISYAAFQTRGMSLQHVYLLDGAIRCPGFEELLSEILKLSVEPFRPLNHIPEPRSIVQPDKEERLAISLGFALRGVLDV